MEYLVHNLKDVNERIDEACKKAGRETQEITLIAVSKTVESDVINESITKGVTDIGENKVQEIIRKYDDIDNVKWHLIGHLQTNKVKYIIDKVDMIHSVDSEKLAVEIDKRAKKADRIIDILLQVNVADEDSKFGIQSKNVEGLVSKLSTLENVRIKGLMTIAPFYENPEDLRKYFRELREIFDNLKYNNKYTNVDMQHLSMGMTNDFEVAIQEGATMLRIGTGIYGRRDYAQK